MTDVVNRIYTSRPPINLQHSLPPDSIETRSDSVMEDQAEEAGVDEKSNFDPSTEIPQQYVDWMREVQPGQKFKAHRVRKGEKIPGTSFAYAHLLRCTSSKFGSIIVIGPDKTRLKNISQSHLIKKPLKKLTQSIKQN